MGKQHWMKFFPSDWRSDSALRSCSAAARGLWIDMIAFMHEADPRGSLLIGGQSPTPAKLAALCAMTVDETVVLLAELEGAGVFSRKKNGIIFSRRMERDEAVSRKASLSGRMGGNPVLKHSNNMNTEKESSENLSRIKGESAELRDGVTPEDTTEKQEPLKHNDKPRSYMLEAREERKKGKVGPLRREPTPSISAQNDQTEQAIVRAWNSLADEADLAKVQRLTGPRLSKLYKRLAEIGGLEGWYQACDEIRQSRFLRGDNNRGWKINFDFMLSQTSLTKLMEGNYRDRARQNSELNDALHELMEDVSNGRKLR